MTNISIKNLFLIFSLLLSVSIEASSLYQITLLRAAPGNLAGLIDESKALRSKEKGEMIIMRHSQGDHWDLLLLQPQERVLPKHLAFSTPIAFQHSFLSESEMTWAALKKNEAENSLYHLEMFHAAPEKYAQLLEQRHMENAYYHGTGRAGNVIFTTVYGSDMDVFTLGFYKSMIAFATDPDLSNEVYAKAATDAGFQSRSSIGLYLRNFLSKHFDTLATKVD